MEPHSSRPDQSFEALRRHRAELRESMSALEHALAAPAAADQTRWFQRLHVALVELSGDFRAHVDITEGPDGVYRDLLETSPRLSGAVTGLTREHGLIDSQVDGLLSQIAVPEVEDVVGARGLGTALLGTLVRHRQRGSDLIYEAYEVDIGGET